MVVEMLTQEILQEERAAGWRRPRPVSERDIRRRRRQISGVAVVLFFGLVVTTLRSDLAGAAADDALFDPDLLRAATITVSGAFIAYAVEKERHLRRLHVLGEAVRRTDLAVADRLLEAAALASVGDALQSAAVVAEVVERTAAQARALLDAGGVSVRLLGPGGSLAVAARAGDPSRSVGGEVLAARAAVARAALLLPGPDSGDRLAAPLVVDGRVLGVVEATASPGERFDRADAAVLASATGRAAVALDRARRYEQALWR